MTMVFSWATGAMILMGAPLRQSGWAVWRFSKNSLRTRNLWSTVNVGSFLVFLQQVSIGRWLGAHKKLNESVRDRLMVLLFNDISLIFMNKMGRLSWVLDVNDFGSSHGSFLTFVWRNWENHRKPRLQQPISTKNLPYSTLEHCRYADHLSKNIIDSITFFTVYIF